MTPLCRPARQMADEQIQIIALFVWAIALGIGIAEAVS